MQLLEYEQQRTEHRRNIDVQSANAARARAGMGNLDAQMARLRQSFGKGAVTDLVEATDKANTASQDLRKSVQRQRFQEVRAPVDGVVQQLAVTTIGGVVQPAQALMVIVPCTTPTNGQAPEPSTCKVALEVEAFVQNKDVGFIAIGQRVAVKLESFNFTDYGMIEGVVDVISRDAIDLAQQPAGSVRPPIPPEVHFVTRYSRACQFKQRSKQGSVGSFNFCFHQSARPSMKQDVSVSQDQRCRRTSLPTHFKPECIGDVHSGRSTQNLGL